MRDQLAPLLMWVALVVWIALMFISERETWWIINAVCWAAALLGTWALQRREE